MSNALAAKRLLKNVVRALQRTLPAPVFDRVYSVGFPAYRGAIRVVYLVLGAVRYAWRDSEGWRMTREIHRVMPRTLVGIGGLEVTYLLAKTISERGIRGDFVELGVARGGCAALLGSVLFNPGALVADGERQLWLFDSYEGLPEPGFEDFGPDHTTGDHVRPLPKGSCLGTLEDVQAFLFEDRKFPRERVKLVKGWFQDTVPSQGSQISGIALLRVDGDWYESTKVCLDGLYDRVSVGGAVIVDDYQSCYGCTKAVDDFIRERNLKVDIRLDGRGGCWFLRP